MNVNFTSESIFATESPIKAIEGSTITLACTFWAAVTTPSALVYRNGTAVTTTVMPAGSASASGNVATLKPLTALVGGARYEVVVSATVSGDVRKKKCEFICGRASDEQ